MSAIYHPPDPVYEESDLFYSLSEKCEEIQSVDPNAKIIISGDTNGLNIGNLMSQSALTQMVKSPIRGDRE